jgi:hypothetical protein
MEPARRQLAPRADLDIESSACGRGRMAAEKTLKTRNFENKKRPQHLALRPFN